MRGLLTIIVLYVLAGIAINVIQDENGVPCDKGDIHTIDVDEPKGLLKYLYWAPNFYHQVVEQQVTVDDYFSPKSCVTDPRPEPSNS